jgi:hypothetical protein
MRKLLTVIALAVALVPACTASPGRDGPEKVVFKAVKGLRVEGPAPVNEILDLGLPCINNLSDSTVELRSVQLVSPPTAVRFVNVRAYLWQQVGFGWLMSAFGDLPKQCSREFTPHPVKAVVTKPRSNSQYMVIIALTISRPGTYHLHKVKMTYVADGKKGWQYQYFDTVIHAFRGHYPGSGC